MSYNAEFKAKVALQDTRGNKTMALIEFQVDVQ